MLPNPSRNQQLMKDKVLLQQHLVNNYVKIMFATNPKLANRQPYNNQDKR
jgi:hypothetical protein